MKSVEFEATAEALESHPVRGAWIEIGGLLLIVPDDLASHPVRGAWIEIQMILSMCKTAFVAPREGCVD